MVESTGSIGGTTAVSGGGVWMPCNRHMAEVGSEDSRSEALAYMGRLTAGRTPDGLLAHYVDRGPDILAHLERSTPLELHAMTWPDYHPEMEGAKASGRMLEPALYDTRRLGDWGGRLRRPPVLALPIRLEEATVEWRPSYTPEKFDAALVQARVADGQVACGQALVGALLEACLTAGIEPRLETRAVEIAMDRGPAGDRVAGLVVERGWPPHPGDRCGRGAGLRRLRVERRPAAALPARAPHPPAQPTVQPGGRPDHGHGRRAPTSPT